MLRKRLKQRAKNMQRTKRIQMRSGIKILIGWQAYRGYQKQPYITPKSNPSKVQKTLAGPIVHLK